MKGGQKNIINYTILPTIHCISSYSKQTQRLAYLYLLQIDAHAGSLNESNLSSTLYPTRVDRELINAVYKQSQPNTWLVFKRLKNRQST